MDFYGRQQLRSDDAAHFDSTVCRPSPHWSRAQICVKSTFYLTGLIAGHWSGLIERKISPVFLCEVEVLFRPRLLLILKPY